MCPASEARCSSKKKNTLADNHKGHADKKIFRPWDNLDLEKTSASCTISNAPSCASGLEEKPGFRPLTIGHEADSYPAAACPGSFAQNLDSFFLESAMVHGYALEEYARVLSQEHQAKMLNARKQRPKKYKCPHCDVGFSNNGQLKGHIRIHTGERPFKCDAKDCGKTFTRNEELTRHKRIHSGLRPFPCTHCGKRFGRKDHLKKHSRTHFQPRGGGVLAVPVMLPFETWASAAVSGYHPYMAPPMYGF